MTTCSRLFEEDPVSGEFLYAVAAGVFPILLRESRGNGAHDDDTTNPGFGDELRHVARDAGSLRPQAIGIRGGWV